MAQELEQVSHHWAHRVPGVLATYNNTRKPLTGVSPALLQHGREDQFVLTVSSSDRELLQQAKVSVAAGSAEEVLKVQELRQRWLSERVLAKYEEQAQKLMDKSASEVSHKYVVGEWVRVKRVERSRAKGRQALFPAVAEVTRVKEPAGLAKVRWLEGAPGGEQEGQESKRWYRVDQLKPFRQLEETHRKFLKRRLAQENSSLQQAAESGRPALTEAVLVQAQPESQETSKAQEEEEREEQHGESGAVPSGPQESQREVSQEYEVEAVLGTKGKGRQQQVLVKWAGWEESTWEPTRNVEHLEVWQEYQREQGKQGGQGRSLAWEFAKLVQVSEKEGQRMRSRGKRGSKDRQGAK